MMLLLNIYLKFNDSVKNQKNLKEQLNVESIDKNDKYHSTINSFLKIYNINYIDSNSPEKEIIQVLNNINNGIIEEYDKEIEKAYALLKYYDLREKELLKERDVNKIFELVGC